MCISPEKININKSNLIDVMLNVKKDRKKIASTNSKQTITSTRKWHITSNIIPTL